MVPAAEMTALCDAVRARGGRVSTMSNADGSESPYELNITYFDALRSTRKGRDELQLERFLCSQTIQLSLRGIPGIYFNNLFGARNHPQGVERTGQARAINRRKWEIGELRQRLDNTRTDEGRVFSRFRHLLRERARHPAFHPDGAQHVLETDTRVFGLLRTAPDRSESVMMLANLTPDNIEVNLAEPAMPGPDKLREADLVSQRPHPLNNGKLALNPYQCVWMPLTDAPQMKDEG